MTTKSKKGSSQESITKKQYENLKTEQQVTKEILDWEMLRNAHSKKFDKQEEVKLYRYTTTGIPDGKGGLRKNPQAGAPDFIGIYLMAKIPVCFFFELKSAKGKQSEAQKKWEKECKRFGIPYYLVRSAAEAESSLASIHEKYQRKISWSYLGISRHTFITRFERGKEGDEKGAVPVDSI